MLDDCLNVFLAALLASAKLRGRCAWTIPATAKGTTLVVTVNGATYRFRVR